MAAELRARPSVGATGSEASRAALALRNKLVVLLMGRMSAVRAAARFVFRGQPEIVREVTSEYERRRPAAGRRAKEKKGTAAGVTGGEVK